MTDQLSSGRHPRSRLPAILLAVTLGVAGLGELGERHREQGALLSCVTAAEADAGYTDRRVRAITSYVDSGLSGTTPARVRASLQQVVAATARQSLAPAVQARRHCEEQTLLPWHGSLRTARSRYIVLLRSRESALAHGIAVPVGLPALAPALAALERALPGSQQQLDRLLSP